MDVNRWRNGVRRHRRGATATVVALALFAALAVSTSVLGKGAHADAAANDPASDQYQWQQALAHAAPVVTATAAPAPDGYHHLIVTTTDTTPPGTPTVGPDGTRGRWARLNAPGTPSRFTDAQQRTLLPYVDDIVLDRDGATRVKVKDDAPADLALGTSSPAERLADMPGTTVTRIDDHTWAVRTKEAPERVAAVPGVASLGDDQPITLASTPQVSDDPMSNLQWALQNRGDLYVNQPGDLTAGADANVPPAWARTRGAGVVVAVIDTSVDFSNPDLAGALWTNPNEPCGNRDTDGNGLAGDCHGWDFGTNSATDQLHGDAVQEHGSHVAGIIAATAGNQIGVAGIAPEAKIMPLTISDKNGQLWVSAAVAAINYAADHHVQVINASWGGTGAMPQVLQSAIDRAEAAGVLFVAAAGNNGVDTTTNTFWPANAPNANVISVGASTGNDTVASFSNYSATKVHVFAPGQYILSTLPMSVNGGFGVMSGTSMASPYVAGEAALLRSLDPSMSAVQTKTTIMQTAKPLPAFAGRSVSGARIDAGAAVAAVARRVGAQAFNFDGFDLLDDTGVHRASVETALDATDAQAHPNVSLSFSLATRYGGQAMAITDYPLDVTRPDGTQATITTDAGGTATLDGLAANALTSAARFGVDVGLPAGYYALALQFHDGAQNLGTPGVMVFEVGNGAPPAPPTTLPAPPPPTTVAPAPPTTTPTTSPSTSPSTTPAPTTPTTSPSTSPTPPTTTPAFGPSPTTAPVTKPAPTPTTVPSSVPSTVPSTVPSSPTTSPTPTTRPAPPTTTAPPAVPGLPPTPAMLVGSAGNGEIALSWSASSGALGYRVYEDGSLVAQTTETSTTIAALVNGQAYEFAVSAYSARGESGRTQPVALVPSGPAPSDPTTAPPNTTAPSNTTTPAPTTVPLPAPTTSTTSAPSAGPYTLSPSSGPTEGGTPVTILGPHLDRATVEIDGARLQNVNVVDPTWMTAETTAHATPGTYDVVLHFPDHDVVLPHAFTYTGSSAPTTTTTTRPPRTSPSTTTPTTRPTTPTTAPSTSPTTPTTAPTTPTTRPTVPSTTTPTTPTTNAPVTTPPTTSAPPVLAPGPNGYALHLGALGASNPLADLPAGLWDGIACRSPRCTG